MSPKDMTAAPVVKRITAHEDLAAGLAIGAGEGPFLTPMQSAIWIRACAETLIAPGDLNIVAVGDGPEAAAIAPLCLRKGAPAVVEMLGGRALGEPADFIFRDAAALASLVAALAGERRLLDFQRLPASSPTITAIREAFRGSAFVWVSDAGGCPRIDIAQDTKDPLPSLSGRLRADLRRAERKAEEFGRASFEIHEPRCAGDFLPLYEEIQKVEAAGWKGERGSAIAKDRAQNAFFRRFGELASEAGVLRLAFLRFGSVAAAIQYAVEWNGAYWLLKVGYDEAYSKCSPGQLLLLHSLRRAAGQGLRSFEFLGGEAPWTRRWTGDAMPTASVRVYPYGPLNMLALGRDLMAAVWEKAAARLNGKGAAPAAKESQP